MAVRRREITEVDLEGCSLSEIACVSCTGACPSKTWAVYNGEARALCSANRLTTEFLKRFNEARQ